jgi:transcriptional regulator with XRE-family HTH domain
MKQATKEIAEKLGISITTVSKALKDYSDVSLKLKLQFLWLKNLIIAPIHLLLICERKNQRQ